MHTSIALQLRDAGFPQPIPEFGQKWVRYGVIGVFTSHFPVMDFVTASGSYCSLNNQEVSSMAYIPTPDDIMKELPDSYFSKKQGDGVAVKRVVMSENNVADFLPVAYAEDAVEAWAMAWFKNYRD